MWYALLVHKSNSFPKTHTHTKNINQSSPFPFWPGELTDGAKQRLRSAASQDSIVIHVLGLIVCCCSSIFNTEEGFYAPWAEGFHFNIQWREVLGRRMIVLTLTCIVARIRASRPCRDRPTWGSDRLDRALDPAAGFNEGLEITGFLQPQNGSLSSMYKTWPKIGQFTWISAKAYYEWIEMAILWGVFFILTDKRLDVRTKVLIKMESHFIR